MENAPPDGPEYEQTNPEQQTRPVAAPPPPSSNANGGYAQPPSTPYGAANPPPPPAYSQQPQDGGQPAAPFPPYAPYASAEGSPPYTVAPAGEQPAGKSNSRSIVMAGILALAVIALIVALGGDLSTFFTIGVTIAPLALLALLAHAATRNVTAMVFTYVMLVIAGFGVLLNSFANVLLAVSDVGALLNPEPGMDLTTVFNPGAASAILWTVLLLGVSALVSLLMLLRPVRVAMSRIMPIDPDNFVHKIALCILTLIVTTSFVPLIALGGTPPILMLIEQNQAAGVSLEELGISAGPLDLFYQFTWTIPATLVAAGWPIVRTFGAALKRLGMVRPSLGQVGFGIAAGVVLAFVAGLVIDPAIGWLWDFFGWPRTNVAAFEELLAGLITPLGAVVIGVTAGIGEEMAVRGLLQPRIGLIFSNLVFTSIHAFQYGFDALLSVFIIGLILGIIRARSNTSTSAIVHGVYDFVVIMASYLAVSQQ